MATKRTPRLTTTKATAKLTVKLLTAFGFFMFSSGIVTELSYLLYLTNPATPLAPIRQRVCN